MGEMEVIPQDLGRVFLNLVSNACYATDERRRAMESAGAGEPFMPELRLSSHRGEDRVVFRVWDNGGGIPPDVIDKIFNPFFTTKPTDQGTGLGLALSSDIARQHGGLIRVETEPGESTTLIRRTTPHRYSDNTRRRRLRNRRSASLRYASTAISGAQASGRFPRIGDFPRVGDIDTQVGKNGSIPCHHA